MKDETIESNKDQNIWMRGLYMLIFLFFWWVAKFVTFVVIFVLFLFVLFTSETNKRLVRFGKSLSLYQYQILLFLTYNSEEHPYPMGEWPEAVETSEITDTTDTTDTTNTTEIIDTTEKTDTTEKK